MGSLELGSIRGFLDIPQDTFRESILVFPIVSVGNVPQLAVDLLLENFPFQLVGTLDSSALIPFYGHGALKGPHSITTALQVFWLERVPENPNIVCLQIRTPPSKGLTNLFVEEIMSLMNLWNPRLAIFLTSFSALSIIPRGAIEPGQSRVIRTAVPENLLFVNPAAVEFVGMEYFEENKFSLFSKFWDKLKSSSQHNFLALSMHVYEGDNTNDAISYFQKLCDFLRIFNVPNRDSVKLPDSWRSIL
ncbi:hypothetical protein Gasu2_25220 [Galdieria sulphuraria]|uniref:Proteasome assembly chaperone 2 n=1 Tax=Galdieria sulphuraria TaxID=130081 RepID=M2X391_GALSU|nr:proteasome chaperone 2 [Galdieria sulphuraria]EME30840.1 proteasome chaperone 2 [Galdieria sulphuraria]GJD08219.1 hypothetical protein Gasu2_25220 [Galdieria sulphuraria]|eukprot:XP_005707360.1 proteasome chaperone 2 [Galdieria sulphuraria]